MNAEELTAVTLARIETKLDAALFNIADHEKRIRALEARPEGITPAKFMTTLVGFGSLAAALASVVTLLSR